VNRREGRLQASDVRRFQVALPAAALHLPQMDRRKRFACGRLERVAFA
jgi:hypothetical protein